MSHLRCQLGNHETNNLVLLNIHFEGSAVNFGCLECVKKHGYWCDEHRCQHSNFSPDGTACQKCIMRLAAQHATKSVSYLKELEEKLQPRVWEELCSFLDYNPEEPDVQWRAMRIMHELATRAICKKTSVEDELRLIIEKQSIDSIFPNPYRTRAIKEVLCS